MGSPIAMVAARWVIAAGFAGSPGPSGRASEPELPPDALTWNAPPGCPTGGAFADRVESLLGRPWGEFPPRFAVAISIESLGGDRWRLRLGLREDSGAGQRVIEDASCELLTEAAALIVALAVDPVAVMNRQAEPARPAPGPSALPDPEGAAPPPDDARSPTAEPDPVGPADPGPPETESAPSGRVRGAVRVSPLLGAFVLPGLGGGLELAGLVRIGQVSGEAYGRYWFPRDERVEGDPALGGVFRSWAAGLRGCGWLGRGAVSFPLCGALEVGQIIGRGTGVSDSRTGFGTWAGGNATAGVAWSPAPQFAILGAVEGTVAIARPRFEITNIGVLHQPAPVGMRAFFGTEVRFP